MQKSSIMVAALGMLLAPQLAESGGNEVRVDELRAESETFLDDLPRGIRRFASLTCRI